MQGKTVSDAVVAHVSSKNRENIFETKSVVQNRRSTATIVASASQRPDRSAAIAFPNFKIKSQKASIVFCEKGWLHNFNVEGFAVCSTPSDLLIALVDYLNAACPNDQRLNQKKWGASTPIHRVLAWVIGTFYNVLPNNVQFELQSRLSAFTQYTSNNRICSFDTLSTFSLCFLPSIAVEHPELHDLIIHAVSLLRKHNHVPLQDIYGTELQTEWYLELIAERRELLDSDCSENDKIEHQEVIDDLEATVARYSEGSCSDTHFKTINSYPCDVGKFVATLAQFEPDDCMETDWHNWLKRIPPIVKSNEKIYEYIVQEEDDTYDSGVDPHDLVSIFWDNKDRVFDDWVEYLDNQANEYGIRSLKCETRDVTTLADMVPSFPYILAELIDDANTIVGRHHRRIGEENEQA